MKTFMDLAVAGEFENPVVAIDDFVDEWHNRPDDGETIGESLHLFLGMTWQEYGEWVSHPKNLSKIIERRRS